MLNKELEIIILSPDEQFIGTLNPRYVDLEEVYTLKGLKQLEIIHPIVDDNNKPLTHYNDLLTHGNKIWRNHTGDGKSCLYIINDDKTLDKLANEVTIKAEEIATELSQTPSILFNPIEPYYTDDFEDGKYTGRSAPYQNWTVLGGTGAIETTTPIHGNYSLRHTGNTGDTHNNIMRIPNNKPDNVIEFQFKLKTVGASATTPKIVLWYLRYVDQNNLVCLETYYNSEENKQLVRLITKTGGTVTEVNATEWLDHKLTTSTTHNIVIEDNGVHCTLRIDNKTLIDVNYTSTLNPDYQGCGALLDCAGLWDIIILHDNTLITEYQITEEFLETYYSDYFILGTITPGKTIQFHGVISPMGLLREIETQTSCEFQFRYEYNPETLKIIRYLDFLEKIGKPHTTPIEIGYNTDNIEVEETEADLCIAAAPAKTPTETEIKTLKTFYKTMNSFNELEIDTNTQIPLWMTKKDEIWEEGPLAYPPYPKTSGSLFVRADPTDSAGSYKEIRDKNGEITAPRTVYFETSEEHPINIYWYAVSRIRSKLQPQVKLETKIVDIGRFKGYDPTHYNVGDTVHLKLPGRSVLVESRIIKTVKNPREPEKDKIEIGNYQLDFFREDGAGWEPYLML